MNPHGFMALITRMCEQWIPGPSFGVGGAWVRGYTCTVHVVASFSSPLTHLAAAAAAAAGSHRTAARRCRTAVPQQRTAVLRRQTGRNPRSHCCRRWQAGRPTPPAVAGPSLPTLAPRGWNTYMHHSRAWYNAEASELCDHATTCSLFETRVHVGTCMSKLELHIMSFL